VRLNPFDLAAKRIEDTIGTVRVACGSARGNAKRMSALGQKPTYALQQAMSALHPKATVKA
jgi:hypothetical protein